MRTAGMAIIVVALVVMVPQVFAVRPDQVLFMLALLLFLIGVCMTLEGRNIRLSGNHFDSKD